MNGLIPFEGDNYIAQEVLAIRDKYNINTIIETGTQFGSTTKWFAQHFEQVYTIEADAGFIGQSGDNLRAKNITVHIGRSEELMRVINEPNALYYLDAHGCNIGGCPLKLELEILATKKPKAILIHDFKVPGKDFGFDAYDYELCIEEIESYLPAIFPNGYRHYYNDVAEGAYRGIIYIIGE